MPGVRKREPKRRRKSAPPKSENIAKDTIKSELTPLDVILDIMRIAYANDDQNMALAAAKLAVPYLHSKFPETDHKSAREDSAQLIISWMEDTAKDKRNFKRKRAENVKR